jgi:hypothetical protein
MLRRMTLCAIGVPGCDLGNLGPPVKDPSADRCFSLQLAAAFSLQQAKLVAGPALIFASEQPREKTNGPALKELMNVMTPTLVHPGRAQAASSCLGLATATATAAATVTATAAATVTAAAAMTGRPADEEDLMTRRQVAVLFRVTSAVVATWARRGRLPEVRNEDGRPRYRRGDVEQLFRSDVARRLR